MMHPAFRLNGVSYTPDELEALCCNRMHDTNLPWEATLYGFMVDWLAGQEVFECETSGSTGHPSRIALLRENMVASARMTESFFGYNAGERAILALPVERIAGKMMVVRGARIRIGPLRIRAPADAFSGAFAGVFIMSSDAGAVCGDSGRIREAAAGELSDDFAGRSAGVTRAGRKSCVAGQ